MEDLIKLTVDLLSVWETVLLADRGIVDFPESEKNNPERDIYINR